MKKQVNPMNLNGMGQTEESWYFRTISHYDYVTAEDGEKLYEAMKSGDEDAVCTLLLSMSKYIWAKAGKYHVGPLEREDFCQQAFLGLFKAIKKFDPSKGKFSTFASSWIHKALYEAFEKYGSSVAMSGGMQRLCRDVRRAINEFLKLNCRIPSEVELSKFARISVDDINKSIVHGCQVEYIEEWQMDKTKEDFSEAMDRDERITLLYKGLKRLDERTREIVCLKNGLGGCEEMKVKDIAEKFDISTERVRQVEKAGREKLKCYLESYGITSFAA